MTNDYLAGLVDGEGYISLIPSYRKNVDKTYFVPVIKIASTNYQIIHLLQSELGGYISKRTFKEINQKDAWCWEVKNKKPVLFVLEKIVNSLIIKKQNAELVIEFCKFPFGFAKELYKNTYNPVLITRSKEIYTQLRQLNHRGINTSND